MQDKVAIVTGSSRGIGRAIAFALARSKVHLAIQYLNQEDLAQDLVAQVSEFGVKAVAIKTHLGQEQSRQEFWKTFDQHFKSLDYFVANAAIGVFKPLMQMSMNSWRKVFAVNVESFLEMTQNAVARMQTNKSSSSAGNVGRIVALSSIGAERSISDYGSVGASKAALESMVRQFACELGASGINVNIVRAGLVDTGFLHYSGQRHEILSSTLSKTPSCRITQVEDVANLVHFLCSEQSSMINGQTLMVDGGHSVKV